MKRQGEQNDVIRFRWLPLQQISLNERNVWIVDTQSLRDLERSELLIESVNPNIRADFSRVISNQSRNIARAGSKIQNPECRSGLDPAAEKKGDQPIATKPAVELPKIPKITVEFL